MPELSYAPIEEQPSGGITARDALLSAVLVDKARRELERLSAVDRYDWPALFPRVSGFGAAGDIRRRVRMLLSAEPRFPYLLFPEERIEFVTKGMFNSFLEQYLLGPWAYLINHTLFLFTNYRVILLNSDGKGRARTMMWQIPYDRVAKYGAGVWFGSVTFRLKNGTSYKFANVPSLDRKRLKEYVRTRLEGVRREAFQFPSHASRDPLCASCATPIPPRTHRCPECAEEFIRPSTPALMSPILPGLGDLYLGWKGIAVLELIGFALVLLARLGIVSANADDWPIAIGVVAAANGIDAAITWLIARKGVLPTRMAWTGM